MIPKDILCLSQPSSERLPSADGNTYRDPQANSTQRAGDLGTLSPRADVSINSLPSELREPCRRGSKTSARVRGMKGTMETRPYKHSHA